MEQGCGVEIKELVVKIDFGHVVTISVESVKNALLNSGVGNYINIR